MPCGWLILGLLAVQSPSATVESPEVRQLVTFSFLPGTRDAALRLFTEELVPLYRGDRPLLRFRGYVEVESPEPLDLVVVSSFQGLSGMDASNAALRELRTPDGRTVAELYREISDASAHHHDQFIEMLDSLAVRPSSSARFTVFEWVQVAAGARSSYAGLLETSVVPWERKREELRVAETGRVLIGDGWDYVRVLGFESLGGLHTYDLDMRASGFFRSVDSLVVSRKRIVLREDPGLRVR